MILQPINLHFMLVEDMTYINSMYSTVVYKSGLSAFTKYSPNYLNPLEYHSITRLNEGYQVHLSFFYFVSAESK